MKKSKRLGEFIGTEYVALLFGTVLSASPLIAPFGNPVMDYAVFPLTFYAGAFGWVVAQAKTDMAEV